MERFGPGRLGGAARVVLVGAGVLGVTTVAVSVLETVVGIGNASATYLLAVVVMAVWFGIPAAAATAIGSFLLYDLLFVQPTGVLAVADLEEWLTLLLLLVLGVVVGQLAGMQRSRAEAALLRERQARAQYAIGRALATTPAAAAALPEVVRILRVEVGAGRVWVALGAEGAPRRLVSDSDQGSPPEIGATHSLMRRPGDGERVEWIRVHDPRFATAAGTAAGEDAFRVPIVAGNVEHGSLWVLRPRSEGAPGRGDTRVLAAAADQVGQAIQRDRLATEATSAEVARRSEAAKSALLDSVSHDLRTPLATIRAAAGILRDPTLEIDPPARRERADVIDREAERLNQLVTNLLDMSRIEAGDLRARLELFALEDVVETTLSRMGTALAEHPLTLVGPADLPPVMVDAVFIDQVLTNLLENVVRHTPPGTAIRVSTRETAYGTVLLTVEDAGSGVPPEALGSLFSRFSRLPPAGEGSRRGFGLGLAVVRGLVEAMGGSVSGRLGDLGGLAVDIELHSIPDAATIDDSGAVGPGASRP